MRENLMKYIYIFFYFRRKVDFYGNIIVIDNEKSPFKLFAQKKI